MWWESDFTVTWYGLVLLAFIFLGIPPTMTLIAGIGTGILAKKCSAIRGLLAGCVFGVLGSGAGILAVWIPINFAYSEGTEASLFVIFVLPQVLTGILFAAITVIWVKWGKLEMRLEGRDVYRRY